MAEVQNASPKIVKSGRTYNWPVLIASALCVAFIVGVWLNNYRVTHAAAAQASIAAKH
jgi:hypothetical protein